MSTLQVDMPTLLKAYFRKLVIACMTITLVMFAWANIFLQADINANAATMEGIGNKIEGKVEKDLGATRRAAGDLTGNYSGEIKGGLQQAKGKAKQDIGTTKNKLDDAKDTVENKSESLIDSVKDMFD